MDASRRCVAVCFVLLTAGAPALAQPLAAIAPAPPENPITEEKRVLGKVLFWDEQLSTSNVVSCGTCHQPQVAGADPRIARNPGLDGQLNTPDDILGSPGVIASDADNDFFRHATFALNPQITTRSANPVINTGFNAGDMFWDGRARTTFDDPETGQVVIASGGGLESQAVGPPLNSTEMAHADYDWAGINEKLRSVRPLATAAGLPPDVAAALAGGVDYPDLFRAAFGDARITAARIAMAIATYERTLVADQTPWDAFVAGNPNALTPQQQQGLQRFNTTARCSQCHVPPLFSDNTFRNIGLRPVAEDVGRQVVTGDAADRGRFKVPSLRNAGLKATFMHNGQFQNLGQVMAFYDPLGPGAPQFPDNRDPIMQQIVLPPQDQTLITDFIINGLRDPRVANQQFPFDRPTLFTDRNDGVRPTVLQNTGAAGTGGIVPQLIVQTPGVIGGMDFRIGLTGALGGRTAQLWASTTPPVGAAISLDFMLGSGTTSAGGAGLGVATVHWPISARDWQNGDVLFVQWIVSDPGAAGGQARSRVGRVPLFCSTLGCPPPCDSLDFNRDQLFPDNQDLQDFLTVFGGGPCSTGACNDIDFNNDGLFPDNQDVLDFISVFGGGSC